MSGDAARAFADALQSLGAAPANAETEKVADAPAVTASNIWRHPDAHPIALDMFLLRRYGPEWLTWEPETLSVLVPEDFRTETLSELNLAKLQACKVLHLVDSFWQHWEVFLACAMPFNNLLPDFRVMQVPTAAQCLVAIDIATRIRDDMEWSEEVSLYIAKVFEHDGIFAPLQPADFITPEVPEVIDIQNVLERWPSIRAGGKAPSGTSHEDEQLRRLRTVHTFLEESRARLNQQLHLYA